MTRKGYTAVRLVDSERKDKEPKYTCHYAWINQVEFPTKEDIELERNRIHREQLEKNLAYEKSKRGSPSPTAIPAVETTPVIPKPKYDSSCKLKLDPNTGNTVLIVASSKAGKTTLQMDIYKNYFKKSITVMFAHSTQLKIYKAANLIVTDKFEPHIIELMRQLNKMSKNKFDFTCMFDDILMVKNSETIQDLFLSLRNSNISSVISLQYVNLMSKACRGNVNTILGGAMNSDENIMVFIKCYLSSYMRGIGLRNDSDMIKYYRDATKDHGFFNIHPASESVSFCRLKLGES